MGATRFAGRSIAAVAVVVALWIGTLAALAVGTGLVGQGDAFSLVHWEVTRLTGFALGRVTGAFSDRAASNPEVEQYFALLRRARLEHAQLDAQAKPAESTASRSAYEADLRAADRLRPAVESRVEQAVEAAIRQAGLIEPLPLYSGVSLVWPPVATGFSVPPHILIVSPRNRIVLQDTTLLRTDLSDAAAARIERNAEKRGVSALVDQIGGLGAYPSIVDENDSPLGLMQTVAHEWTHEYLVFHPLGARYAASNDMTLINETVADLVGRELGAAAYDSLGLPPGRPQPPTAGSVHHLDFNKTLHDLRLEVDLLLKQGRVDEAERRMNETQDQLAADGYNLRRINQAYFAFYGSYGDSAAASSPLGGEVQTLRRSSPDLKTFVHRVQNVASPADLSRLLRASRAPAPNPRPLPPQCWGEGAIQRAGNGVDRATRALPCPELPPALRGSSRLPPAPAPRPSSRLPPALGERGPGR